MLLRNLDNEITARAKAAAREEVKQEENTASRVPVAVKRKSS